MTTKIRTKKQPASTSTQVSIRMSKRLRADLENAAADDGRTLSQLCKIALADWLARNYDL